MRNLAITVMSLILTTIVIGNAYYQKKQFYPSVVYITKSNPSMAIIYIQAFIIVIIVGKLMRRIFFGELRAVELEHLMERSWYAITETCLAFTVFRDDFNPKFLALFTLLLFLKAFHWLADERVDYMERSPVISWLFHIRIISLLIMLGILDVLFVCHAYQSTLNKGASVQLVFGFEYAILLTIVLNIVIKYAFHVNDFHELPWENKAVFLLYTELIMGFIKVILYFSFVIIMVRLYTLPLFAFRPMYYTVRAFKKAVNDVVMSRRAIRNMNTLYPDATAEELAAMDNVCIICREEMRSAAKKLPCNHIFHTSCLRSWFQRQQTCPTCRLNILRTPVSNGNGGAAGGPNGAQGAAAPAGGGGGGAGINGGAGAGSGAGNGGGGAGTNNGLTPTVGGSITRAATGSGVATGGGAAAGGGITTGGATASNAGSGSSQQTFPGSLPDNSVAAGSNFYNAPPFTFPENIPLIPPFPYMAFNVPPPIPPPEGLSDEELRRLEQDTREGLEQRIRCLQSIQSMLDTSILMMQQYCAAVSTAANNYQTCAQGSSEQSLRTQNVDTTTTETPAVLHHHTLAETSGSGAESSDNELHHTSEENLATASHSPFTYTTKSSEWTVPDESRPTRDESGDFLPLSSSSSSDRSTQPVPESQNGSSTTTQQEMLRQRRLEKFSKTN